MVGLNVNSERTTGISHKQTKTNKGTCELLFRSSPFLFLTPDESNERNLGKVKEDKRQSLFLALGVKSEWVCHRLCTANLHRRHAIWSIPVQQQEKLVAKESIQIYFNDFNMNSI
jgi:hypothetical protein